MKNKFQIAMTLAVVFAMVLTSLALADQITSDADILLANNQASKSLGNVAPGAVITAPVSFILECNGNKHVDNGQIVNLTFSLGASTVAAGGNLSATNASIGAIPATWPDDGNNCPATPPTPINDNGDSTVTITAPSVPGLYTYVVGYTRDITAPDVTGGNTTATFTLTVVAPADSTSPIISYTVNGVYPASPNGSNGWYTSNVLVDWTVSDPESSFTTVGCADTTISSDTAGITSSCSATSAGGTSSDSVTIKRDATAPAGVSGAPNRTADNGTWYNHAVDIVFTGIDATSGIASCTTTNYSGPDDSGVTVNGSCTDSAGNLSASVASSAFNYDGSAPTGVVLSVTAGTSGANGWYTSDVTVHTSSDADISGVTCTLDQSQTAETAGTVFNGSCTNGAGLTTNAVPLTVKLDKSGPSAALAVSAGTPGANGWYTSDVTVSSTGSDSISSPVSCSLDQFQTTETTGQAFNGSCTNDAGLSTNAVPLTVKLDKSGPSAALAVSAGTPGANGWYTSDVTVSSTGSDSISSPVSCSLDQFQTTETTGQAFNGSCTNDAGLSTNAVPLTVKLDKTGPSASLSASGTFGNNGWYISDVTITTAGSDSISNPTACSAIQSQITDTASATFNGSCINDAGLTTNAAPLTIKRDATAPSVAWFDVQNFYYGFPPATAPSCQASDGMSGPFDCVVAGYNPNAGTGAHPLTATAHDMAGNETIANNSYTVNAWRFNGFFQPVDMSTPSTIVYNTVKNGSTVPLKFEVFAGATELTDTTVISASWSKVTCAGGSEDGIEVLATGGTSLRYDTVAGQFIYNWKTPNTAGACYKVSVTTADGSSLSAYFKLK